MIQQDAVLGERYKQAPAYGKVAVKFHTVWTSAFKKRLMVSFTLQLVYYRETPSVPVNDTSHSNSSTTATRKI
jgi:hypothetical protein